jgi:hypothetical protein
MTELSYQILLFVSLAAGAFSLVLALLRREPSWWSVGSAALTEIALLGQLVFSIVLVSSGASATGDTVEYFGYIITALLVPVGSVVWAVFERTKWSTLVIGLASFTVAVMVVRMWQIWSGNIPHF